MTAAGKGEGELLFVPLGGAGEIGMNLNLYGYGGKWLMVDLGVTFGDPAYPGIDLVMPDPAFIAERRDDLVALVLTHAHEDHIGAVPYLWPRLRCPVYATPFTAVLLRAKLAEAGLLAEVPITEVALGGEVELGPFHVRYVSITHSIPEGNAVAIRTPAGMVFHTGDWKLDPEPMIGSRTDEAALAAIGDDRVLAMVCDSTNVFQAGESGSEAAVRESLMALVGRYSRRVAITTFASHIARVATVAAIAEAHGRDLVLVGRALQRTVAAARATGYLADLRPPIPEADAGYLPPDKVLLLCTGCQGEPRGATARIAVDDHPSVALEEGDAVIFSSKIIPGNEIAVARVYNQLVRKGVQVVTERRHFVHVSGHPNRGELERMYALIRPQISVPVHGEVRHLTEHARLARSLGIGETVIAENGSVVRLAPGPAAIVGEVAAGRLALDGDNLVATDGELIRQRRRVMYNGSAAVTLVLDAAGREVAPPSVAVFGLEDPACDLEAGAAEAVSAELARHAAAVRADDGECAELARRAARRYLREITGKRPVVEARVVRVGKAGAQAQSRRRAAS